MGISYITENHKYPDYIRSHQVFTSLSRINKIFPCIGLPNCEENCSYNDTTSVRNTAQQLLLEMRTQVHRAYCQAAAKKPNEPIYHLLNAVYNRLCINLNNLIAEENGRLILRVDTDIVIPGTKDPIFKGGEKLFGAYNKLITKCDDELDAYKLVPLESLAWFKRFSSENLPNDEKKFKLTFSSDGEKGAWDIATMSMRGIQSCQSWGTPQSRGLIGSISSKYVGVIYISSPDPGSDLGSRMIRRSVVRFCINKKTKQPALLVDRIYPSDDTSTRNIFRSFLEKKANLPVLFPDNTTWNDHELPSDRFHQSIQFQQNEFTYMDTRITILSQKSKKVIDPNPNYHRIAHLDNKIAANLRAKYMKMLDEYVADNKCHKEIFKGGVANYLISLKKRHGGTVALELLVPKLYPLALGNGVGVDASKFEDPKEYEKAAIKAAFKKIGSFEEAMTRQATKMGKWARFYPKSIAKLTKLLITSYKSELVEAYKLVM